MDKTVLITGANGGLGFQCARSIANAGQGWHSVIAQRGQQAANLTRADVNTADISVRPLDLASLASVRQFAVDFSRASLPCCRA